MSPAQVEQFLTTLNDAWINQDYVRLSRLYDNDVVLLPPDAGPPIVGRDAVLESYRDFHRAARVEDFRITEQTSYAFPDVDPKRSTLMVHMRFAIDYQLQQTPDRTLHNNEQGLEVYTLIAQGDEPTIVWRAQFAL